jgi:hypothetical protein
MPQIKLYYTGKKSRTMRHKLELLKTRRETLHNMLLPCRHAYPRVADACFNQTMQQNSTKNERNGPMQQQLPYLPTQHHCGMR